jgi:Spirocyclase AveC-like
LSAIEEVDRPNVTAVAAGIEARRMRPVLWWAAIGIAAVAVQTYVYVRWIAGPNFRPVPTGPDRVPHWEKVAAWLEQGALAIAAIVTVVWAVRGCIKAKRFTLTVKLLFGTVALVWLDPIGNMVRVSFFMNSYYINRGSWAPYIPGWISPNAANLPDPFLVEFTGYLFLPGIAVVGCWVMKRVKARRPQTGRVGLLLSVWLFMMAVVVIIHQLLVERSGWAVWAAPQRWLTVFAGTRWQLPLVPDVMCWAAMFSALASLLYFQDASGASFVERGIERVGIPARLQAVVSTFAVIGYTTVAMLGYAALAVFISLYPGDTLPNSLPSYIVNQMCGPATQYECPRPGGPISVNGRPEHPGP